MFMIPRRQFVSISLIFARKGLQHIVTPHSLITLIYHHSWDAYLSWLTKVITLYQYHRNSTLHDALYASHCLLSWSPLQTYSMKPLQFKSSWNSLGRQKTSTYTDGLRQHAWHYIEKKSHQREANYDSYVCRPKSIQSSRVMQEMLRKRLTQRTWWSHLKLSSGSTRTAVKTAYHKPKAEQLIFRYS